MERIYQRQARVVLEKYESSNFGKQTLDTS